MKQKLLHLSFGAGGVLAALVALGGLSGSALAGPEPSPTPESSTYSAPSGGSGSVLANWWNGNYASGDWFGVRTTLEDYGFTMNNTWKGFYYGIADGKEAHGAFDEEIKFRGILDFGKLTKVDWLSGLSAYAAVRWRDGTNPNNYVGANSAYGPSDIQSGKQWRFNWAYLSYTTPELFGVKNFLTISGGWQDPYDFFHDQPLTNLFVNNTFSGGRGINNIPWSSSYGAWGGYMKVKPSDWFYVMSGLYEAIPDATSTTNHGLDFAGVGPNVTPNPGPDGLETISEVGFTPKIGPQQLPGKYAFGGYYFGVEVKSFNKDITYPGNYGFYWQADQMLFRQPTPAATVVSDGKSIADGKSEVDAKTMEQMPGESKPALSDRGLYYFGFINYSPAYNNLFPFTFQSGLVYKGLIPTRDNDQLMAAFALGNYSIDNINNLQSESASHPADANQPNYTCVLEFDYRIQVTKFASFQPFVQYIIQPAGTQAVPNAAIIGWAAYVNF